MRWLNELHTDSGVNAHTDTHTDRQTQRVLFRQRGQLGDVVGLVTPIRERVTVRDKRDAHCVGRGGCRVEECVLACDICRFNLSLKCFTHAFQLFKKSTKPMQLLACVLTQCVHNRNRERLWDNMGPWPLLQLG